MIRTSLTPIALVAALIPWAHAGFPKCEVRAAGQGGPAILIGGSPHSPLFFFGNNQFGRDEILLEEMRLAYAEGFRLFAFGLHMNDGPEAIRRTLDTFCGAIPDGYFYAQVWVGPPLDWLEAHPAEAITRYDGSKLNMASPSSAAWRAQAADRLRGLLKDIERSPYGARLIGISLNYLNTAEWFYPETNDFMDYSPANLAAFRAWLKREYKKDARLQEAWGAPDVTLATAEFPTPDEREAAEWGPFRHPVKHQRAMDMQRFQSEMMAETIAYFARIVKQTTRGRSLAGAYYGYTMELNHNGPRALAHSGHLALGKLLDCGDLDIIQAPYSYFERQLGLPGHFHFPLDSIGLHGKLAIIEEDSYTHLTQPTPQETMAPGWNLKTATLEETIALNRRNFANAFGHGAGMWIFDLLSDARWNDARFWRSAVLLRRMAAESRDSRPFEPQIAVVMDEESVHYLRANTHPFLLESLAKWRAEWARVGAPVGYYLQSDVTRLPKSIRLLVYSNAYRYGKAEKAAADSVLERGGAVLWTYAPGIYGPNGADPAAVQAITGFELEAQFQDGPVEIESVPTGETAVVAEAGWSPRFVVNSQDAQPLARYRDTREVAAAIRLSGNGLAIYSAVPRLPVGLLRHICERAGVHLYTSEPSMTALVGPYLVIHNGPERTLEFHWPSRFRQVERMSPLAPAPIAADSDTWTDGLAADSTVIYRVSAGP